MRKPFWRVLITLLISVMLIGLFSATSMATFAADGDVNVVPDPQLQACINETMFGRAANTPISAAEIASMGVFGQPGGLTVGTINAVHYPGITSFEGLQGATHISSIFLSNVTISDLSPLAEVPDLTSIIVSEYTTPDGTVDLTPLAPIAANMTNLKLFDSTYYGDVPTTRIIGLGLFTGLTTLTLSYNALTDLPGLSSLTKLDQLYLLSNYIGNNIITQIPNKTYLNINLAWNSISDFTGLPSATTLYIAGQQYVANDVLLASADEDTYTFDPADRPIPPAGKSIYNDILGGNDVGPITFDKVYFDTAEDIIYYGCNEDNIPSAFEYFTEIPWHVNPEFISSDLTSYGWSYSYYPTAIVDIVDNNGLTLTTNSTINKAIANFSYSVDDPSVPVFTPVSYALASGTLPAGLSIDPVTGNLVGKTTSTGAFDFEVSATDANDLTVIGSFTVTLTNPPPNNPPVDPVIPPTVTDPAITGPAITPSTPPAITDPVKPEPPDVDASKNGKLPDKPTVPSVPQTGDIRFGIMAAAIAGGVISLAMILGLAAMRRKESGIEE